MALPEAARPARPAAVWPSGGRLSSLTPAWAAFFGSLILSLIAVWTGDGPNRDGMLYLDNARVFLEGGVGPSLRHYDWPFFAIAIALVSKITGLGLEPVAFLLCGVLLAGASAMLVNISQRMFPSAGWAACLAVLALPAINDYRDNLIREFGFWMFGLLAVLLALRWAENARWQRVAPVHLAIAAAVLFRLEAVAIYPALVLWQATTAARGERPGRVGALAAVPLAVALVIGLAVPVSGIEGIGARIQYYLSAIDPFTTMKAFRAMASHMIATFPTNNAADDAGSILFFGLLSLIPLKFIKVTGILLVPLAFAFSGHAVRQRIAAWQPLGWLFLIYVLVLVTFFLFKYFLVSRYVSFLSLLAVPLIATGLAAMLHACPRWRAAITAIALGSAVASVISLGPGKAQYAKAGAWLAANVQDRSRVYPGSDRAAYYAGWPYGEARNSTMSREALTAAARGGRFDLIVLDSLQGRDAWLKTWTADANVVEVTRFANRRGDAVVIFRPNRAN